MRNDGQIDYVEFPAPSLDAIRTFYTSAFDWTFDTPKGAVTSAQGEAAEAEFSADPLTAPTKPLVMIYSRNLDQALRRVQLAGGVIVRPISPFHAGRRFLFRDPAGNELGVWSDAPWSPEGTPMPGWRQTFTKLWLWRNETRAEAGGRAVFGASRLAA